MIDPQAKIKLSPFRCTRRPQHRHLFIFAAFAISSLSLLMSSWHLLPTTPARAASATCPKITGQGTIVSVNGVPNSGLLDFDNSAPSNEYAACLDDNGTNGQGPFLVKGWVWDSNLGWVSFFCDDEDNNPGTENTNLGISCGNQKYGVTMDGQSGQFGKLHNFAWGDNTGWISFNCDDIGVCASAPYYVQAEPTGPTCIGKVFVNDASCPSVNHPPESTFAWSDNVGWLDLTNVVFPLSSIINPIPPVTGGDIQAQFEINPNPKNIASSAVPWADGFDGYNLILHLTNKDDGKPIDSSLYDIQGEIVWTEDSVDVDQTDTIKGDYKNCGGNNCGAVTKPLTLQDFSSYGTSGLDDAFVYKTTSVAPTSDENGDGTILFKDFFLGHDNVPESKLVIDKVKISVVDNDKGNCIIGDENSNCSPIVIWDGNQQAMPFQPAVGLKQLEVNDPINKSTIEARYNVAKEIKYKTFCHNKENDFANPNCNDAFIELKNGVDSPFNLVVDTNNNGADCTDAQTVSIPKEISWSDEENTFQITPVFEVDSLTGNCKETGPSVGNNAYVYSTVYYKIQGKEVHYFSNKLPRNEGTLVVNPVASVKGQVYSQGITNPQSGDPIRSLGDVSTNILRDTITRNVYSIVAGVDLPKGNALIKTYDNSKGFLVDDDNSVRKLLVDDNGIPKAYYFMGDVTLGNGIDDISWNGQRTIIVEGGDVYINSNIYNIPGSTHSGELGLIVLKDLGTGKGGNIFVGPNVTNIQATMFADKSFFSYDGASSGLTGNNYGEPLFTDETQRFNTLKNQLYIQGSLASMNTLGGAVANPPFIGDGTLVSAVEGAYGVTPAGRRRARLYDLNFLRYYGLVFERDNNGNAIDKDGDGQLEATPFKDQDPNSGDLIILPQMQTAKGLNRDQDFNPVYITFKPPSATLPGFGVSKGIDVKVRP